LQKSIDNLFDMCHLVIQTIEQVGAYRLKIPNDADAANSRMNDKETTRQ
uniref:DUF3077 domain-containing protein n=1 Tax=Gongylonema pulchrum TaxID=637853 RepID=A0A183DJI8_9BILA